MNEALFCCPICRQPLQKQHISLTCPKGHSYDLSAQGYVNLLLSKHSKSPGDGKEMVAARTAFLNGEFYAPLAREIAAICAALSSNGTILDAGCGDGYYLSHVASECQDATLGGVDISKEAVRAAAKRLKCAQFAVANCFELPFSDATADVLLQVFAPASDAEYCRILKQEGKLISVIPGRKHLLGLKELLYENPYENDEEEHSLPSFHVLSQKRILYDITLSSNAQIQNLFMMTPYFWRTKGKGDGLSNAETLCTPVEFVITIYEKKSHS